MNKLNSEFFNKFEEEKKEEIFGYIAKDKFLSSQLYKILVEKKEICLDELEEEEQHNFFKFFMDTKIIEQINFSDEKLYSYTSLKENMVSVEGGKYKQLSSKIEVEIANLLVGKYPVTQNVWEKIMRENPSETGYRGPEKPVNNVSWLDALEFCNKISELSGLIPVYKIKNGDLEKIIYSSGEEADPEKANFSKTNGYRLPTSVEWEWVALGGVKEIFNKPYSGGYYLGDVAWYYGNSDDELKDVGIKRSNELGIYDMTGNIWEWCYDTYLKGEKITLDTPYIYKKGWKIATAKGGSFRDTAYTTSKFLGGKIDSTSLSLKYEILKTAEPYTYDSKNFDLGLRIVKNEK